MKRKPRYVHAGALAAGLLSLAGLAGCSASLPAPSDSHQARELLTAALDSWKRGETPEALAATEPSIRVRDRQWREGWTLRGYQLKGDAQPLGLSIQQAVALEMKNPKGRDLKKEVNYVVTTGGKPMVARQDIDE